MKKSRLKKKSLKSKLTWIFIALAIFLGGSVYAALQTGTGPLSFLTKTPDINASKTKKCIEDPGCVDLIVQSAERGVKVTNVSNLTTTGVATQIKNNSKNIQLKGTDEDKEFVKDVDRLAGKSAETVGVANPADLGLATGNSQLPQPPKPESCQGGNGVKLTPGKYAATGYGWTGTDRDLNSGAKQRECVYIDENCNHGPAVACDKQYILDRSSVILPVNAGPEYYAGKTPAQIREDEKKNNIPPPAIPKENCYDKSGVIMVTGSSLGDDKCFNGEWLSDKTDPTKPDSLSDLDNKIIATCSTNNTQAYDKEKNECITPVPPAGNIPSTTPTAAEIQAQQDKCRGESKEYDIANNACGQKDLKCGPGYVERAGFCDLAPGSTSEIIRENIKTSGEKFCDDIDKKFDPSTGLCQSPTKGRPFICVSGSSDNGTKWTECKKEDKSDSSRVTGSVIKFCNTSLGFDKLGNCQLTPTNFGSTPAANNNLTPEQNNKLNDPAKPWAANNPVLVSKESDCPDGSSVDSVYLPNTNGPTFRCTPESISVVVPPAVNPKTGQPLTPATTNSTPPTNPANNIIGDNSSDHTMKEGTKCLTKGSCSGGCDGGLYTEVKAKYDGQISSSTEYYCGDQSYVAQALTSTPITNGTQTIVKDNSSEQTLGVGQECSTAILFNSEKCKEKCDGGVYTEVAGENGRKYYCGTTAENQNKINTPSTENLTTDQKNQLTEGALGGAAIGGTVGALVCGGLAWGLGSLTFGGTIVLAPAAAAYCATLGAGLGATIGGINSY